MKIVGSSSNGRKHCGENEKLLVTNNFCFSPSVFNRLVLQTRKNQGSFGKGLKQAKSLHGYKSESESLLTYTYETCSVKRGLNAFAEKVSTNVSLRIPRRLTWAEFFRYL